MPLTQDQEVAEHELRMDQMTVNIEKMRSDMLTSQKQLAWETRKFIVQVAVGIAAAFGAGAAVATFISHMH